MKWFLVLLSSSTGTTLYSANGTIDGLVKFEDCAACESYRAKMENQDKWYCGQETINLSDKAVKLPAKQEPK